MARLTKLEGAWRIPSHTQTLVHSTFRVGNARIGYGVLGLPMAFRRLPLYIVTQQQKCSRSPSPEDSPRS